MPERQTPAIVLTVREYGEADLMVNFLTPEYGPLTGIAKHARKSRRRFAHCLEPLSRVVFFLSPRAGRDLEFLQKGELVQSFPALRRDLKRLGAAAILAEVAGLLAGPPEAYREIFAALEEALGLLEQGLPPIPCSPPSCSTSWIWGATGPASTTAGSAAVNPPRPLTSASPGAACSAAPARAGSPGPCCPSPRGPGSSCAWPRACPGTNSPASASRLSSGTRA